MHKECILYAVLEVGDGVFEVLSTSGDTHLGGDDFDKVCPALCFMKCKLIKRFSLVEVDRLFF